MGSVLLIGLLSKYFGGGVKKRVVGALLGATIFYIITNFGVWSLGMYGYTLQGLIKSYILAIPFFAFSFLSTFIFSCVIEILYSIRSLKILVKDIKK